MCSKVSTSVKKQGSADELQSEGYVVVAVAIRYEGSRLDKPVVEGRRE